MLKNIKKTLAILLATVLLMPTMVWAAANGTAYEELNLGEGVLTGTLTIDGFALGDATEKVLTGSTTKYRYRTGYYVPGAPLTSADLSFTAASIKKEAGATDQWVEMASGTAVKNSKTVPIASDFYLGNGTTALATSTLQAWEVKVQIPANEGDVSNADGEARLFIYGTGVDDNEGWEKTANMSTSPVIIKNGGVYLADSFTYDETAALSNWAYSSGTGTANPTHTMEQNIVADGTLTAGKWYRVVRMMDLKNVNHMQKVFVYDENDNWVGESDWCQAGIDVNEDRTPGTLYSMSFYTHNYLTEAGVRFDDLQIYDLTRPDVSASAAKSGEINKVGKLTTFIGTSSSAENNSVVVHESVFHKDRDRADLNIKVKLENSATTVGLFGLPEGAQRTDPVRAAGALIVIEGGKVYCRTADPVATWTTSHLTYSNANTDGIALQTSGGEDLVIEPNTWYDFNVAVTVTDTDEITASNRSRTANLVVTVKNSTGETLASKSFTKKIVMLAGSSPGNALIILGINEDAEAPIYFDDISLRGWKDGDTTKDVNLNCDFTSATVGGDLPTALTAALGTTLYKATYADADTKKGEGVVDEDFGDDFLATGKLSGNDAPNVELRFTEDVDPTTITKDNIYLMVLGQKKDVRDVSYDSDTNKATVIFNQLAFGNTYTLVIENIKTSIGIAIYEKTYTFTVVADPFSVTSKSFVDAEGNPAANALIAKNAVIKGKVELKNTSAAQRDYIVILAIYNSSGEMIDATVKPGKIGASTTLAGANAIVTDALTATEDDCRAKIMVWENLTNMKPKTGVSNLPAE